LPVINCLGRTAQLSGRFPFVDIKGIVHRRSIGDVAGRCWPAAVSSRHPPRYAPIPGVLGVVGDSLGTGFVRTFAGWTVVKLS
jgi:hypothetical protein